MPSTHRAGLVGAGSIAEHHLAALRRLPRVELVGVADIDEARARGFAERLGTHAYPSLAALREAGADVIHVLTPPDTHARVAAEALEAGCHVLVEKPLSTSVEDCQRLQALAERKALLASVDHSLLFDPQVARAIDLVRAGKLGRIVSVDILRGSAYPPWRGGPLPPQYRSAAYPFRDLGVHAFYLLEAFLGPIEDVSAAWQSKGGDRNLAYDEWRALVRCRDGLGQFQLSWNVRPMQSLIIVQGTRGVLRIDLFLMFHALRKAMPVPKAIERVVNALTDSVRPLVEVPQNIVRFAAGRIRPYQGLHNLVTAFYQALDGARPLPVTLSDGTAVVRWVEQIARAAEADHAARLARLPRSDRADVLVTGASGGLGGHVLRRLAADRKVRAFSRRPPAHLPPGVDVVLGDLGDAEAVDRAVRGVSAVIHAGAAMAGGREEHDRATILGTRNVVDACRRHGVGKLVHISSMSVSDWAGSAGGVLSESSADEPRPAERGDYTRAKLEAEKIVRGAASEHAIPAVILRPGQIFGDDMPLLTPAVARRVGARWLVLGDGELKLPLVEVEDVVDGIVSALDGPLSGGEVVQLVDPCRLTQNQVLAQVLPRSSRIVRVPRALIFAAGWLAGPLLRALKRKAPAYRLRSALSRVDFASEHAERLLGWRPRVGVAEGVRRAAGGDRRECRAAAKA